MQRKQPDVSTPVAVRARGDQGAFGGGTRRAGHRRENRRRLDREPAERLEYFAETSGAVQEKIAKTAENSENRRMPGLHRMLRVKAG
ncbi:MAG: hypothetical protein LBU32_24725 [Clostridiales bacterium]|nr:hypothetical protein [Clostridiales bacterium]